jgi:hypothetical protein
MLKIKLIFVVAGFISFREIFDEVYFSTVIQLWIECATISPLE